MEIGAFYNFFLPYLQTGFDYTGKLNLLQSKKGKGTDEEWETEIGALIAGTASKKGKSSIKKLNISPTRLVTQMCSDNWNQVQLAALGMYALLKEGQPFDENAAQSILEAIDAAQEKFGSDIFLQLILDLLRGLLEAFFEETASGESFVAPPFQKGLPFFPSHTKQVAIKLKKTITKDGAQALLAMIKKVDGRKYTSVLMLFQFLNLSYKVLIIVMLDFHKAQFSWTCYTRLLTTFMIHS